MNRTLIAVAVTFLLAPAAAAKPKAYTVEPTNATIGFSIVKWSVVREEGEFRKFNGTIWLDQKNPAAARVEFNVDSASIDTKNENRDSTVRSKEFLDVARHPALTFRSTRVAAVGKGVYAVTGDMTIKGVKRRITIPVRLLGIRNQPGVGEIAAFETSFAINRHHYGVTGGRWTAHFPGVLGDELTIRITAAGINRG